MYNLPQNTILGTLNTIKVFEFYDEPVLFSCKNLAGQKYISVLVDMINSEKIWYYLPISTLRYEEITKRELSINIAFKEAEDGFIFKINQNDDRFSVEKISTSDLHDEDLPSEHSIIISKLSNKERAESAVLEDAIQTRAPAVDIAIESKKIKGKQLPIEYASNFFKYLQNLVDSIAQVIEGQFSTGGRVSESIKERTRLSLCTTYSGSFGIVLKASDEQILFGDLLLEKVFKQIDQLLSKGDRKDDLIVEFAKIKARSISNYRNLLEQLSLIDAGLKFSYADHRKREVIKQVIDKDMVKRTLQVVNQIEDETPNTYEIRVELIGFNSRVKSFEIWTLEEPKEKYTGQYNISIESKYPNPIMNSYYMATILEKSKYNHITEEISTSYELVDLQLI